MEEKLSNVLITGSNGMVGAYIDFGIKTDRDTFDITDKQEVIASIKKHAPKVILHLAAETDLDECEQNPSHAYAVNTIGTYNIALGAKEVGAKMIYVSTSAIFDGLNKEPYTENDLPNPQNQYGCSKYLGEVMLKEVLDDYVIIRTCWVFGGGKSKDKKFVSKIISQIHNQEIKTLDNIFASPTYGKDLVEAIKSIIKNDKRGIFHIVNDGVASRYDMAILIAKILGSKTKITKVEPDYFNLPAERGINESMVSNFGQMRPWQEALEEYIKTEWK